MLPLPRELLAAMHPKQKLQESNVAISLPGTFDAEPLLAIGLLIVPIVFQFECYNVAPLR